MNPKVLVGCPTYNGKGYCLKEYAEAVKNLTMIIMMSCLLTVPKQMNTMKK